MSHQSGRTHFLCILFLLCSACTVVVHGQANASLAEAVRRPSVAASSTPPSVYDSFATLLQSLKHATDSLSANYKQLVENDTSPLSNWIAYSQLLKPINNALIDGLFPELVGNSDLTISNECLLMMMEFAEALNKQQSWAYRLLDSSGNFFPTGSMTGSFSHLGDFDECIETSQWLTKNQLVEGKYCLLKYNIYVPTNKSRLLSQDVVFNTSGTDLQNTFFDDVLKYAHIFKARSARVGICIPSVCSQADIQTMIGHLMHLDKVSMKVDSCQTIHDCHFTTLQKAIIAVLSTLVVMVILATTYELYYLPEVELTDPVNTASAPKFTLSNVALCFSAYSNTKALMTTTRNEVNLPSVSGIRVLTMCWLVYAHAYFLSIKETFRSSTKFIESIYDLKMYFVLNAWPAVEVFFIISALIHSYTIFSWLSSEPTPTNKHPKRINVIKLITSRIVRMWPNLWLTVGLVFLMPSLAQGPLWPDVTKQQVNSCQNTWWKVPFFVSNFRSSDDTCHLHTWYISVDTQLYVVSFIFIKLLYIYKTKTIIPTLIFSFTICFAIALYFYLTEYVPTILFNNVFESQIYEDMARVYMPTYFHINPYICGMFTGFALSHQKSQRQPNNNWLNFVLWAVCLGTTGAIILIGYYFTVQPYSTSLLIQAFYAGFHRFLWSVAVSYLIYACETGQGGIIAKILSHRMFVPLSKLAYLVYLLHYIVTWARTAYLRAPLVYSNYTLLNEFIVNLVFSIVLAFVFHLLVGSPCNQLYKFVGARDWKIGMMNLAPKTRWNSARPDIELAEIPACRS